MICTLDGRLRRHVEDSGSAQAAQLVTPDELLNDVKNGTLEARLA